MTQTNQPLPDPQWTGIYDAQVAISTDPTGKGRVRLLVPQVLGNTHSAWATPMQPGLNPAVGDSVYCHFLGGNPNLPQYFLGLSSTTLQSIQISNSSLNNNPMFIGGVTAPWMGVQATLTPVTPNPDTNPPYPTGVLLTAATTQGMSMQDQPFDVVPGSNYSTAAWVFSPPGQSVFIGMGFNDSNDNPITGNFVTNPQIINAPAGTWTYLTNVVMAPSNAVQGYPVIGVSTTGLSEQLTVESFNVQGQIPGQLIAPASIGTTQVNFTAQDIGGVDVSIQATAPNNPNEGDFWFNTSQDGALEQWNGTAWQLYQFGSGALKTGSIVAGLIAAGAIDGQIINGVTINGNTINAADLIISATNGGVFCYSSPAPTVVTLTSGTSWPAPTGVSTIQVECWGGGGGGGYSSSNKGGGGGGGEYAKETSVPVTAGNNYTYAIGAGGAAGTSGGGGGGGGGATVVQFATATINGITNPPQPITASFFSNTTAGNAVIAVWVSEPANNQANSTVSGITLGGSADHWGSVESVGNSVGAYPHIEMWADPNCVGGQKNVVVTATGGSGSSGGMWYDLLIMEVSGLLVTNSVATLTDQTATDFGNSGSFTSTATSTTTQANEFAVGFSGSWGSDQTLNNPSSWTNVTEFGVQPLQVAYKPLTTTQTVTFAGTQNQSRAWTAGVATFKLAGGSGGNSTNGGTTTFTGDSGHVVTANGGSAATSSTGGNGGTGSSNATHHNGGVGANGSNSTVNGSQSFTTSGNHTWQAPAAVTTVKAQVWGGGGGGDGITQHGAYGGGGGGFAQGNAVAVTPGNNYTAHVGAQGASGSAIFPDGSTAGGNSTFAGDSVTITGNGGHAGGPGDGAGGGGTGDVVHSGGSGGRVTTNAPGYGGGGGGSGGPDGSGANGTNGTASTQGKGGAADGGGTNGGNGGNGGLEPGNGAGGGTPGGGGGSAGYTPSNEFTTGGSGATGQVKLSWSATTNVAGGGGGSGGSNSAGNPGGTEIGAAAITGGGPGGGQISGGVWTAAPANGPGGGGGGTDPNGASGAGAAGQIKISYTAGSPVLLFSICGAAQNDPITSVACPEGPYLLENNPLFFQGAIGENAHGQIAATAAKTLGIQAPKTASSDNQASMTLTSHTTGGNATVGITGDTTITGAATVTGNAQVNGTLTAGTIVGSSNVSVTGNVSLASTNTLKLQDSTGSSTMATNTGYLQNTVSTDGIVYNLGRRVYALATTQTVSSGTYSNVLSWTPGPVTVIPVEASTTYYIRIFLLLNIGATTAFAMKPVTTGSTSYALWYVNGTSMPGNLTTAESLLQQPLTTMGTGVGSTTGFTSTCKAEMEGIFKASTAGNFSIQMAINSGSSYTAQQGSWLIIEPVPDI